MTVVTDTIGVSTKGNTDIHDITSSVQSAVKHSGLQAGVVTVFVAGSTAAVSTVEYEPGLVQDLKRAFDEMVPANRPYQHHERWHDDNGHSHVRATLMGPSLTVPFADGKLSLGTWQQIVLIDFDTRPREREIVLQIIGE